MEDEQDMHETGGEPWHYTGAVTAYSRYCAKDIDNVEQEQPCDGRDSVLVEVDPDTRMVVQLNCSSEEVVQ